MPDDAWSEARLASSPRSSPESLRAAIREAAKRGAEDAEHDGDAARRCTIARAVRLNAL